MTSKESLSEKCHHNLETVTTGRWSSALKARQSHRNKLPASWNYKKANWDAFREAVDRKTAALELPETKISSSVALFNKAVLEAAKMFIPRGRCSDYQPYWTPELDTLHKAIDQARERMESSPTNANVEAHSKAKAQYTRARTQATRNSWHEKTASLNMEKDMTSLWNLTRALNNDNPSKINTVIETNNELITEKRAANVFADLYQEQSTTHVARERIKEVREETENIILSSYGEERDCSLTDPFSMKELKNALKKMKTKKAPGPDGITGEMLKHLWACSRAVFLKIFNHSWMKGVVLSVWKEAIVIPVPEKGKDKKNPRSYRPISLLSCVGKLLERMVNRRLINHLESNNVLSPTQTGYRKHRRPTCLPCAEHRRCIPGEKEGSGSLLRSLKWIWQCLERGTSCKTTEDRCVMQDVHVDPALPICKDCPSKTWWHSQQKSLSLWRSTTGRCSVPPHCSWSTSMISSPLYQRGSQTHCMQTTWQSGMRLSTLPLQPTGSKKPSVVSASGHWTGASR